uniref:Uncharacterized protein n=1 Tax=Physcomitrium patens TaxID=3218 RepID=A0A2K1KBX8_PHYPA|nr:hypothetical protein PHYPA_010472 [Physcomitrium patens]
MAMGVASGGRPLKRNVLEGCFICDFWKETAALRTEAAAPGIHRRPSLTVLTSTNLAVHRDHSLRWISPFLRHLMGPSITWRQEMN